MKKTFLSIVLILVIILSGCKYNTASTVHMAEGIYFNTYVSVKLFGCGSKTIANEAIELCSYYEKIFSRTMEDSVLYAFNDEGVLKVDGKEDKVLGDIVTQALVFSDKTGGGLDITVEPLTTLWNFTGENKKVPEKSAIDAALKKVDYTKVAVTQDEIILNDVRLDLGAVAKGYVADRIKEFLLDEGVTSALINLGGNVLCIGDKPDGSDFSIGIKKPFSEDIELALNIDGYSVVTSGTYERYFEEDGELYHHILNPKTGMPCDNGVLSVTIISEESFMGDCLSTGCFVMGLEAGLKLVNEMDGVYAIYIDEDYQIHYSEGAENFVKK